MTEIDGCRDPDDLADRRAGDAGCARCRPVPRAGATSPTRCACARRRPRLLRHEAAEEMLGFWQDQTDWTQIGFVAERDGEIVGAVKMTVAERGRATSLEFDLMPDPEHWGEGIEEALLAAVEARGARARASDRPDVDAAPARRTRASACAPPTGFGSIPADDRQTQFMLRERLHARAGRAQQRVRPARDRSSSSSGCSPRRVEAAGRGLPRRDVDRARRRPSTSTGSRTSISRMSTDAPTGGHRDRRAALGCRARRSAATPGCRRRASRSSVACVAARADGHDRRLQRARDRRRPHGAHPAVRHARAQGAPRPPARHDREVREPAALARARARSRRASRRSTPRRTGTCSTSTRRSASSRPRTRARGRRCSSDRMRLRAASADSAGRSDSTGS